jgi:lysine-N-methylase
MEPIDELWPTRLKVLRDHLKEDTVFFETEEKMFDDIQERDYEYEHLAVYFVYRYFMKCRTDGDIYSKGCLAVFCILLIRILDTVKYIENGGLSKEDRVQNAKDCSKEIEYSEENLALLAEMFWEEGFEKIAVCL